MLAHPEKRIIIINGYIRYLFFMTKPPFMFVSSFLFFSKNPGIFGWGARISGFSVFSIAWKKRFVKNFFVLFGKRGEVWRGLVFYFQISNDPERIMEIMW